VRRRWLNLSTLWPSHSQWSKEQIRESHHPGLSSPLQPRFGSLRLLVFSKDKIAVESEEICDCDGHTVHKFSQRRLTADWLASRESDCSRMRRKVSSDWLPSYIKVTGPVLDIFKMAGYFPGSPSIHALPLFVCFFADCPEAPCKILQVNAEIQVTSGINFNNLHFIFLWLIYRSLRTLYQFHHLPIKFEIFAGRDP